MAPQVGLEPTTLRLTACVTTIQSKCYRVLLDANVLYQQALWKQSNYLTVLYDATVCASGLPSVGTKMGTVFTPPRQHLDKVVRAEFQVKLAVS